MRKPSNSDPTGDSSDQTGADTLAIGGVASQPLGPDAAQQSSGKMVSSFPCCCSSLLTLSVIAIALIALWWIVEPIDDDEGARMELQTGGLIVTIALVILIFTTSRLYVLAGARLARAEEDEQSQRLVELLAAQQHAPALHRLLERMQREGSSQVLNGFQSHKSMDVRRVTATTQQPQA